MEVIAQSAAPTVDLVLSSDSCSPTSRRLSSNLFLFLPLQHILTAIPVTRDVINKKAEIDMAAVWRDPKTANICAVKGEEVGLAMVGSAVGDIVGPQVGSTVGIIVGICVGKLVETSSAPSRGSDVGESVSRTRVKEYE